MVATKTRARPDRGRTEPQTSRLASGFFRSLNSFLEPVAEAGCLSPEIWPAGLIVLETIGRRSGRRHRTPVLAMIMDDYVIVRTFRGERSDWFQNLRANPEVSYWAGNGKRRARATVHTPGEECQTAALPPLRRSRRSVLKRRRFAHGLALRRACPGGLTATDVY